MDSKHRPIIDENKLMLLDASGWFNLSNIFNAFAFGYYVKLLLHLTKNSVQKMLVYGSLTITFMNMTAAGLAAFLDPGDGSIAAHYVTFFLIVSIQTYAMNATLIGLSFPIQFFGRLVGITECVAGICSFIPILIYKYKLLTTVKLLKICMGMCGGFSVILPIMIIIEHRLCCCRSEKNDEEEDRKPKKEPVVDFASIDASKGYQRDQDKIEKEQNIQRLNAWAQLRK